MSALVRILLYLLQETLYRWMMRFSSPLSRFLVVFFLSFCGLSFLSSYVLSVQMLRVQINRSGADLIVVSEFLDGATAHTVGEGLLMARPEEYELHVFCEPFVSAQVGEQTYPLAEYMPDAALLLPPTGFNGVFVIPEQAVTAPHPEVVIIESHRIEGHAVPPHPLLSRIWPNGVVLIPHGSMPELEEMGCSRRHVLKLRHADVSKIAEWESVLNSLSRMDKRNLGVISSRRLMEELADRERSQYRFRVAVSVGISLILCALLTAVSSMEFRQSEYVYALMSSFGVSRILLYFTFVAENAILVFGGFAFALLALWQSKDYLTHILYRTEEVELNLWALEDDIRTFCLAFGLCVPISTLPILVAVCRPIGKILK